MRLDKHGAQLGAPVLRHRSLPRVRFGSRNQSRESDVSWDTDTLPEGETKSAMVRAMFDAIAPRYDMVNRIMTFRLDVRWRKRAVRELRLPRGSTVLDLASGTGDLCVDLAKAGHKPLSMDLSFGMLSADRSGSPRAQSDILRLPVADGSVDGAMCGFALRNLVDLDVFFRELARVVRPGGRISLLDVGVPHRRLVRFRKRHLFPGKSSPASVHCSLTVRPTGTFREACRTYLHASSWCRCFVMPAFLTPYTSNSQVESPR